MVHIVENTMPHMESYLFWLIVSYLVVMIGVTAKIAFAKRHIVRISVVKSKEIHPKTSQKAIFYV